MLYVKTSLVYIFYKIIFFFLLDLNINFFYLNILYHLNLEEIQVFINYTRDLRFDDRPDYGFLKRIVKTISEREKIDFDFNFEWNNKKLENVYFCF